MHYNAAYYEGHYGRLMQDEWYFNLRAGYWKTALTAVQAVPEDSLVLDYGCGTGQVSMAFPNTHYYDIAPFSRDLIKKRGRVVYEDNAAIPPGKFDFILSSHALEHSPRPFEELQNFGRFAKPRGHLLLLLPVEHDFRPALKVDGNNHLYCWTFQTIGNLLHAAGWEPLIQTYVYDSYGLGALGKLLPAPRAVALSWQLGRMKRSFKSMMVVARNRPQELAAA
jgi:SAM-dependent methyltransferase